MTRVEKTNGRWIWSRIRWLAYRLDEFGLRDLSDSQLPFGLFPECVGSIDTVPVYVWAPKERKMNTVLFSGKYKDHVLKFQAIVRHDGLPIWFSGPHPGRMHDARIATVQPPPVPAGKVLLGDSAYESIRNIVTPEKRKAGQTLSYESRRMNRMIQFYRSPVEHFFSYVKRFRILSGRVRIHISEHSSQWFDNIQCAFTVAAHLSATYIRLFPLRNLELSSLRLCNIIIEMDNRHNESGDSADYSDLLPEIFEAPAPDHFHSGT